MKKKDLENKQIDLQIQKNSYRSQRGKTLDDLIMESRNKEKELGEVFCRKIERLKEEPVVTTLEATSEEKLEAAAHSFLPHMNPVTCTYRRKRTSKYTRKKKDPARKKARKKAARAARKKNR